MLFLVIAVLMPFTGCTIHHKPLKLVQIDIPEYLSILNPDVDIHYVKDNNAITLVFNEALSKHQDANVLYTNASNWEIAKYREKDEHFTIKGRYEMDCYIEGNKLIIKETGRDGDYRPFLTYTPISAFVIEKGLKSIYNEKLDEDIIIYQAGAGNKNEKFVETSEGVQPIIKRKNDKIEVGFFCDTNTLNLRKELFTNLPVPHYLTNKINGKKILKLRNGDSFEILSSNGNYYKVRVYYKKDKNSSVQPVTGFIEKKFVFTLPEPLNSYFSYYVYSEQIRGAVVESFFTREETKEVKTLPYFPVVETYSPIGGESEMVCFTKTLPLTSDRLGVLEAGTFALAIRVSFLPGPPVSLLKSNLTEKDFSAIKRFYEKCSEDITKMINEFAFPHKLESVKPKLISLTKKDLLVNSIYMSWVSSCKGKSITAKDINALIKELAEKVGENAEEKAKIKKLFNYPLPDSISEEEIQSIINPNKGKYGWFYIVDKGNDAVEGPIQKEREKIFFPDKF